MSSAARALSIITAVGRVEDPRFQLDLAQSVDELARLRGAAPTTWIRAFDRAGGISVDWTPAHVIVRDVPYPAGAPTGAGATRNRALAHAGSGWIAALDSDDMLVPSAFAELIEAVEQSGHRYAAALTDDVDAAGTVIYRGPDLVGRSLIPPNYFLDHCDRTGILPWLCSGAVIVDADLLIDCGGWAEDAGLVHSDDVALMGRVSAREEGLWFPKVVLLYRKHPGSVTADPTFRPTPEEAALVRTYAQS